jgi:hypothetical protein
MFDEYRVMRLALLALIVSVVVSGCTQPNPASCADGFCSDPSLPFCDVDGAFGGIPDTCIAVTCTPNEFAGCRDDHALTCTADGGNFDVVDCEFGCGDQGCLPCTTSDCEPRIIPKYIGTECNELSTGEFAIIEDSVIDTSDDSSCSKIVTQPTGPQICVVHYESIRIAANRTLRVTGARAIALVADRLLTITGVLDASADNRTNGPGGGTRKSGQGGSGQVAGGGAGNRTAGGHGGNAQLSGGGLNGGAAEPSPASLTELFGGLQSTVGTGAAPGGAGGAVTVVCCRCELSVSGTIDVHGGGGGGQGVSVDPPILPPGGGGSGGNVVLQGMQVNVEGQLFSNGGGGGGTATTGTGKFGSGGEQGRRSTDCADGGSVRGGRGGCLAGLPRDGGPTDTIGAGGAGGGSTGYLLTYTPDGVTPLLSPFAVSPAFEPNGVIPTN